MNVHSLLGLLLLGIGVANASAQNDVREKAVIYARVTGHLEKIHVKPGLSVKKGDLLFEIDSAVHRAELAQVSAEVAVAEALIQRHTAEFERAKRLVQADALTREEFDKISADRTVAQANLNVVRARLELAKLRLEFTKIRAPIDGTILWPMQAIGSVVKADETILGEIMQGPMKPSANIRALQKERHALLVKASASVMNEFATGRTTLDKLMEVERALLEAALDVCDTPAQRVEVLRDRLSKAENYSKQVEARFNAGVSGKADTLQANAYVLEIRIRLMREEELARAQKHP